MPKFRKAADIRVGAIGYGPAFNMGRAHLEEMKKAGMTPAAVADPDPARRKAAAEEFPGIETYASAAEMLRRSDVHLLAVITPHNTHAALALQCLRAGRHVVCEKPFAITTAECDAMIAEARRRKLVVSTYHNRHWDGCILQAVKTIREEKAIGEVVRIEAHMSGYGQPGDWWRSSKSISGGILYDWGVHLLEYALQLLDGEIAEVGGFAKRGFWASQTRWKGDTNEDEGYVTVRFKDGRWLSLLISSLDSNPRPNVLDVTGTKGSYTFHHGEGELITSDGGVTIRRRSRNPAGEGWRFYQNIADHLTRGEKLIITPEWARRMIHILDLADRSARSGKALRARYA